MNSLEKIHALADEYNRPPSPDGDPMELMISSAVMTLGPTFLSVLPDDPAVLDQGLTEMALKLLDLRSDGSDVVQLAGSDGQPLELEAGP